MLGLDATARRQQDATLGARQERERTEALLGSSGGQVKEVEVWREHLDAVQVFEAMATQWRWSSTPQGDRRVGMDYGALPAVFMALRLPAARRREAFEGLRVMEGAALRAWRQQVR